MNDLQRIESKLDFILERAKKLEDRRDQANRVTLVLVGGGLLFGLIAFLSGLVTR